MFDSFSFSFSHGSQCYISTVAGSTHVGRPQSKAKAETLGAKRCSVRPKAAVESGRLHGQGRDQPQRKGQLQKGCPPAPLTRAGFSSFLQHDYKTQQQHCGSKVFLRAQPQVLYFSKRHVLVQRRWAQKKGQRLAHAIAAHLSRRRKSGKSLGLAPNTRATTEALTLVSFSFSAPGSC